MTNSTTSPTARLGAKQKEKVSFIWSVKEDIRPVARTVVMDDVSGEKIPVTIVEPTELGTFRGEWTGAAGVTFRLLSIHDAAGNSS